MDTSDPKSVTVWLVRALAYVAYAYVIITQLILLQGFLLLLFGANPTSSYVQWAYRSLERVMEPFRGIFTPVELNGDSVLDTSVLFAMFIYGLLILVIRALLDWLTYRLRRLERMHAAEEAAANMPSGSNVPAAVPPPATTVAAPPPADTAQPADTSQTPQTDG